MSGDGTAPSYNGYAWRPGGQTYRQTDRKFLKQMTEKTFKEIMEGYADNHTKDTYTLYNSDTKRVIMTRYVQGVDWKMTDSVKTLKMF